MWSVVSLCRPLGAMTAVGGPGGSHCLPCPQTSPVPCPAGGTPAGHSPAWEDRQSGDRAHQGEDSALGHHVPSTWLSLPSASLPAETDTWARLPSALSGASTHSVLAGGCPDQGGTGRHRSPDAGAPWGGAWMLPSMWAPQVPAAPLPIKLSAPVPGEAVEGSLVLTPQPRGDPQEAPGSGISSAPGLAATWGLNKRMEDPSMCLCLFLHLSNRNRCIFKE